MRTPLCDQLGIEYPIFAFTHCRDVVAAVSKAGGFGVLGAVGFSPEQLGVELDWIDEHVGDAPYGVDVVIPGKYEGMGETDPDKLAEHLRALVPAGHIEFAKDVLAQHGVPELPEGEGATGQLLGWTEATATPQVEMALASRQGAARREHARHAAGGGGARGAGRGPTRRRAVRPTRPGAAPQGRRPRHRHRAGHRRRWAHRRDRITRPLAAGRRGGRARSRSSPPAGSAPARRSPPRSRSVARECGRARSGSPSRRRRRPTRRSSSSSRRRAATPCAPARSPASRARMIRNDWTDAWERPDTPDPLPMPLQYMVSGECVARADRATRSRAATCCSTRSARPSASCTRCARPRRRADPRRGVPRGLRAPRPPQRPDLRASRHVDPDVMTVSVPRTRWDQTFRPRNAARRSAGLASDGACCSGPNGALPSSPRKASWIAAFEPASSCSASAGSMSVD